jgi:uncharacterized repeat protein (TIGR01451 family)
MSRIVSSRVRAALALFAATAIVLAGLMALSLNVAEASPNTLLSDGFESAGNLTGWTADAQWQEAGLVTNSGSRAARVQGMTGSTPDSLTQAVSTAGYDTVKFSYAYRIMAALEAVDHVKAQWSPDYGTTWYTAADYTNEAAGNWQNASFTLPAGANDKAGFQVRFQATFNGPLDAVRIDDVKVTGEALAAPEPAEGTYIYNSIPDPQPASSPSLGYQATQTNEFGDYIKFAGTDRTLVGADVMLNSWACQTGNWYDGTCANPDPTSTGYTHPVTLTVYNVDTSGPTPVVGSAITSVTQPIFIPWRPASSASCTGSGAGGYLPDCSNGYNFIAHFDLPNVYAPDAVVYGISFNTQSWGEVPTGDANGPYNALNFSVPNVTPSVGTDMDADAVFWNTETASNYTGGGVTGTFRQDTNWTGNVPAARFSAISETGTIKIHKYECPANTTVTRSANGTGTGSVVPEGCVPQEGATFGYVHGDQTDANGPYPELGGPITAAGATDEDGNLKIENVVSHGRYLVVETNESNQQLAASDILGLYCEGDGDTSDNNDNQELTFVPVDGATHCIAYNKAAPDTTAPSVPVLLTPANGSTVGTNEFDFTWEESTDNAPGDLTYQFHSSLNPAQSGGVLTDGLWTSPDPLTSPMIHSSGAPDGTWYWQVRAQDAAGNWSGWSDIWNVTIDTTVPPPGPECTPNDAQVLVSDASEGGTQVDGHDAVAVAPHPAWTASIPGATWIYSDALNEQGSSPTGDKVFTRHFTIVGTPKNSTLEIATDNSYSVSVNGHGIAGASSDLDNFSSADTWTIAAGDLQEGDNVITITVTNPANNPADDTPFGDPNPAGLLYKLTVNSETCTTPETGPIKVHIFKYLDNGDGDIAQVQNGAEGVPLFPMRAVYDIAGLGTNLGEGDPYNLGDYGSDTNTNDEGLQYAADTVPLSAGDTYGTHEVTDTESSPVVSSAELCEPGKYYLKGYKVGDSLPAAEAASYSLGSPFFEGITSSKYVIVVNQACEASGSEGPDTTSNDLAVNKTVDDDTPDEGQTITYTITALNESEDTATANVSVSDMLPEGLTYVSSSATAGSYNPETGVWTIGSIGPIPGNATLTIVATVNSGTGNEVITNTATISAEGNTDYHSENNSSDASVTVNQPAEEETEEPAFTTESVPNDNNNRRNGSGPGSGGNSGGLVLGASTDAPAEAQVCSTPLLTKYMRLGLPNDPSEVSKLQTFLNGEMSSGIPVTGFFGPMTEDAVKAFQLKYASDILAPWGITQPTGYVFKRTLWKVNMIYCSALDIPAPQV